jgi:hypothetical protein
MGQSVDDFLTKNPAAPPPKPKDQSTPLRSVHVSGTKLEDAVGGSPPDVGGTMSGTGIALRVAKLAGLGIMQGVASIPAGVGDFMNRAGMDAVFDPLGMAKAAQGIRDWAEPKIAELEVQLKTGIFSTETQKRLAESGDMISSAPSGSWEQWIAQKAAGAYTRNLPDISVGTPGFVGNTIGQLPLNTVSFKASGELISALGETAAGKGLAKKAVAVVGDGATKLTSHLASSSLAVGTQSYLLRIKDGVSNWMDVAKDIAVNAGLEFVGMPLSKAWKEEVGPRVAKSVVADVAEQTGKDPGTVEAKLAEIRGGGGVMEPALAESLVKRPDLAKTPLGYQAKAAVSQYWNNVVPKNITVNGDLDPQYGISFDVFVDNKKVTDQPFKITRGGPGNEQQFAKTTDLVANRLTQLSQGGKSVRIDNVTVAGVGTWQRFSRRLKGEPAQFGKMDARTQTAFEQSLGQAAPAGTIAESGVVPQAGTKVTVSEPNKAPYVGVVAPPTEETQQALEAKPKPRTYPKVAKAAQTPENMRGSGTQVDVTHGTTGVTAPVEMKNMRVWLQEKQPPQTFVAHPDGDDRRIAFNLASKTVEFEAVDGNNQPNNWFRSPQYAMVDHDGPLNNDPRGFIHPDGSVTLSVTKGTRLLTYPDRGLQAEAGPLDSVDAGRTPPSSYRTYAERSAHNEGIGDVAPTTTSGTVMRRVPRPDMPTVYGLPDPLEQVPTRTVQAPFQRQAGFVPQAMQERPWIRDPQSGEWRRGSRAYKPLERVTTPGEFDENQPGPVGEITAAARGREYTASTEGEDFAGRRLQTTRVTKAPSPYLYTEYPERYSLDKSLNIDDPAFSDAQKAARLLLSKNMDPKTPAHVVVTETYHHGSNPAGSAPTWTLEELAHAEPGLFDLPQLRVAAVRRGYRAIPDGVGVLLRDTVNGGDLKFPTRLEAASFLSKQNMQTLGPKIEQQANDVLKLGWIKSFDPAVDGGDFVPSDVQHVALGSLIQNQRSLIKVWVASEESLNKVRSRAEAAAAAGKTGVAEILSREAMDNSGLGKSLRSLEDRMGVTPNTFRARDLGITQGDKSLVAIYNPNTVERLRQQYGEIIDRHLKVRAQSAEQMIDGLAKRDAGLEILSSPDPESSILYAAAKNVNNRSLMEAGKPTADPVTGRTYRIYPDEVKQNTLNKPGFSPCNFLG